MSLERPDRSTRNRKRIGKQWLDKPQHTLGHKGMKVLLPKQRTSPMGQYPPHDYCSGSSLNVN
ncbi:hypothetical protein ALP66_200026 [Pseudomonas amygdali pv. photiniae]|nr:hypothetical protein ALP66_200026 [Pseudomonas amygdali pv. photiniae]